MNGPLSAGVGSQLETTKTLESDALVPVEDIIEPFLRIPSFFFVSMHDFFLEANFADQD